jgi:hypothetical protein
VLVSAEKVSAWEHAYRRYTQALDVVGCSQDADHGVVDELVSASRLVATAWRAIAVQTELPWWMAAAVESAAEAFDGQADQDQAGLGLVVSQPRQLRATERRWQ